LKEKYISFITVQQCYEIRKNYATKYIENNIYENARVAIKAIEQNAIREIPNINTEKVWQVASNEYQSSMIGNAIEVHKVQPQSFTRDYVDFCSGHAHTLIKELPKSGPKKDF
jgi:hypothetical protein